MTVIQIEKMNKFGLHLYMLLVALNSFILGNICLMIKIQSILYIIMYRKEVYNCFQPIYSIVVNKNGSGVLCDTLFKFSYFDGLLGRHLEYWSYARFAKLAKNVGFLNYRPRRTFRYIVTNVVLRRPPTRISKRRFHSYLLH